MRLLTVAQLAQLRPLLNYVNVTAGSGDELAIFCARHKVPTKIHIEGPDGRITPTRDSDRKAVLLNRIIKYLETGEMPQATTFRRAVISNEPLPSSLTSTHCVYYGQYKNGNVIIDRLLTSLTGGVSTFCAVGQEVIRDFWSRGIAPTYAKFAETFVEAYNSHKTSDNPEWAFLNDLQRAREEGRTLNKNYWRVVIRPEKARQALAILDQVTVPSKSDKKKLTDFFQSDSDTYNELLNKKPIKKLATSSSNDKPVASLGK